MILLIPYSCLPFFIFRLKDCYVKLATKLKQTGGGLKDGEGSDIEDDSPDENTPESAHNLFGE